MLTRFPLSHPISSASTTSHVCLSFSLSLTEQQDASTFTTVRSQVSRNSSLFHEILMLPEPLADAFAHLANISLTTV